MLTSRLLCACLLCSTALAQVPKRGGVYFRVDDDHTAAEWQAYTAIFNKYGVKASLAVNPTELSFSPNESAFLRDAQSQGHELMDHTPDHAPQWFERVSDLAAYEGREGVDHINGSRVCLQYAPVDPATIRSSGFADIANNLVISRRPGEFQWLSDRAQIAFPSLGVICCVTAMMNSNPADPDSLAIESAWNEPIALGLQQNVPYMTVADVGGRLTDAALRLLAERSLALFAQCGLGSPVSWIQPGGCLPSLDRRDLKRIFGQEHQYVSGASYVDRSLKVFNEYNPDNDRQFAMQWGDFDEQDQPLGQLEATIADKVARHFVVTGLSHFENPLDGWAGYLTRMDSLLAWCQRSGIPVRTEAEWARILYATTPDPSENIIPPLHVDLDGNGVPDGYMGGVSGVLDRTEGSPGGDGTSYRINGPGLLLSIQNLAGVEKADNELILWLNGTPGSTVTLSIAFPEQPGVGAVEVLYAITGSGWKRYTLADAASGPPAISVPPDISLMNLEVRASPASGGAVSISGMEMRALLSSLPMNVVSKPGWNLKSIPLHPADSSISAVFPHAASDAFRFQGGYLAASTVSPGTGYWLNFSAADTAVIVGTRSQEGSIGVTAGWNLIGPYDQAADTSGITSTPEGIVSSPFYAYGGGYTAASALLPGEGYWVKASQGGVLRLGPAPPARRNAVASASSWLRLDLRDARGLRGAVSLAPAGQLKGCHDLPPLPPSGLFDVRFASGADAEEAGAGGHRVQLHGAVYPVIVEASHLDGRDLRLKDALGGAIFSARLPEGEEVTLAQHLELLVLEESAGHAQVPGTYSLSQNYPNPFNPVTTIRYGVPARSWVSLSVYTTLGQLVAQLVDGEQEAGVHETHFDGATLASGTYYYRMRSGDFVSTRKFLLLR